MKPLILAVALALMTAACGDLNPAQPTLTSPDHNQKQAAGSVVSILD